MRCRAVALLLLSLALMTPATAQSPDPGALVTAGCAAVGTVSPDAREAVPLCPQEDPGAPAAPGEEDQGAHAHDPSEGPVQQANDLASEAQEAVQGAVEEPATAPARLAAIVASIRAFVEDLIELPRLGIRATADGIAILGARLDAAERAIDRAAAEAGDAFLDGLTALADAARESAHAVGDAARSLLDGFRRTDASIPETGRPDTSLPVEARDPTGALGKLLQRVHE